MASHGNHCRRVPGAGRGCSVKMTAAPTRSQTRVLALYALSQDAPEGSFPEPAPYYTIRERTYRKVLGDALGDQLDYYSELLDRYHFPDPSYESDFEDYLVRKYGDRTIDVLIANGPDEAALAGRLQARLASQPPIVFIGLDARRPVPKSTGHTYRYAMKESLDLALRVHPDTRHAFVVCGASPSDAWYENEFRSQVPAPPRGVEFTFLRGHFEPALTDRLAALPEHSIVFLVSLSSDGDGRRFRTASVTSAWRRRATRRSTRGTAPFRAPLAVGCFQPNWPPKGRVNSHCACCAASDPRTFRSPLST